MTVPIVEVKACSQVKSVGGGGQVEGVRENRREGYGRLKRNTKYYCCNSFFAKRLNRKPNQFLRVKCWFFTREDPDKRSTLETPLEQRREPIQTLPEYVFEFGKRVQTHMQAWRTDQSVLFHCADPKYYYHIPISHFMFKLWKGPGMHMKSS